MIAMQISHVVVGSAVRVTWLGFTAAGSVSSSIISGTVVFWLWLATTSPIQSVPLEAKGSKTTQQGQKEAGQRNDAGTISAGPGGFISSCKAEPLQLARTAEVECAPDNLCDSNGLGEQDKDTDATFVSPLGDSLMVSNDRKAVALPHSSDVSMPWLYAADVSQDQHRAQRAGLATRHR